MKQQESKTDETRSVIIAAAQGVFRRYGFEKTSMDDIARHAHKSKRSIYNYFESKADVAVGVARYELEGAERLLEPVFADKSVTPLERVRAYLLKRMEVLSGSVAYGVYLKGVMGGHLTVENEAVDGVCREFDRWEREQVMRLWNGGEDRTKEHLKKEISGKAFTDMLQMVMRGLSASFFVEGNYEEYKRAYVLLVNIIVGSVERVLVGGSSLL